MTSEVTEQLAQLQKRAQEAREKVAEHEAASRRAARELERTLGALEEYLTTEVAAGRDPDPEVEQQLTEQVERARSTVSFQVQTAADANSEGGRTRVIGVDPVDRRAEALLRGARIAAEEAEQAATEFERQNAGALLAERMVEIVAARDRLAAALVELGEANEQVEREATWVHGLGQRTGLFDPAGIPQPVLSRATVSEASSIARSQPNRLLPLPPGLVSRKPAADAA